MVRRANGPLTNVDVRLKPDQSRLIQKEHTNKATTASGRPKFWTRIIPWKGGVRSSTKDKDSLRGSTGCTVFSVYSDISLNDKEIYDLEYEANTVKKANDANPKFWTRIIPWMCGARSYYEDNDSLLGSTGCTVFSVFSDMSLHDKEMYNVENEANTVKKANMVNKAKEANKTG